MFSRPFLVSPPYLQFRREEAMRKVCVECGNHVPIYLNYLCEECWRVALNEKVEQDEYKGLGEDGENSDRY